MLIKRYKYEKIQLRSREVKNMEARVTRRLDFSKLNFSNRIISSEEALKDVEPFDFDKEILAGNKKIIVIGCNKK